jgi:hypothetical protein
MTETHHPNLRPWYCNDRLCDEYVTVHRNGGDLRMLKSLKVVRAIVVNLCIAGITYLALMQGADATTIGGIGLASIATYNGIEIGDYLALAQAVAEVKTEQGDDGGEE